MYTFEERKKKRDKQYITFIMSRGKKTEVLNANRTRVHLLAVTCTMPLDHEVFGN